MRNLCRTLLLVLILGLPFEYFFFSPAESLYSSLKLQLVLFLGCWAVLKATEILRRGGLALRGLAASLPGKVLLALVLFAAIQGLAALAASEHRINAAKSAVKSVAAVVLVLAAADITRRRYSPAEPRADFRLQVILMLALAGLCVAIIGLGEVAGFDPCERIARIFRPRRYFSGSLLRLASTMEYPNTAGHFLAAGVIAALALLSPGQVSGRREHWKTGWSAAAGIMGAALLLTLSLGAIGSALIAVILATTAERRIFGKSGLVIRHGTIVAALTILLSLAALGLMRPPETRTAEYGEDPGREVRHFDPGLRIRETIRVRNTSSLVWKRDQYGIAYQWHRVGTGETTAHRQAAAFAIDVAPGEERTEAVAFESPVHDGEYLLIWFVFEKSDGELRILERSYSPAILAVVASPSRSQEALSNKAMLYLEAIRSERRSRSQEPAPQRTALWHAAVRMFLDHPVLGAGPDNFRLLKERYAVGPVGDETILANSLFLEILAGSGIAGLGSMLWLMWVAGRTLAGRFHQAETWPDRAASWFGIAYFGAFLLHGTVDYFLKFTPTYLLFWITLGVLCARPAGSESDDANRL